MVAVSIFAIVMVIAVGSVLAIVSADKKAQALNSIISNLNFAAEGMFRDLRTGYNYDCNSNQNGLNDCIGSDSDPAGHSMSFTSAQSQGKTVTYSLSGGRIYKEVEGQGSRPYPVTAPEVKVEKLDFYIAGTAHDPIQDNRQPRILIVIAGKYSGYGSVATFSLQTLVSQRKLDI